MLARWSSEVGKNFKTHVSFLEQIRMRAGAHKNDGYCAGLVNQKEVTPYVAFAMVRPAAFKRMVQPLGTQRCVVCDEAQHGCKRPCNTYRQKGRCHGWLSESKRWQ